MEVMTSAPLQYPRPVARPTRQLEPTAEKALRRVRAAHTKIQKIEATRDAALRIAGKERSAAIDDALKAGFTLRTLGQELGGISPQRVQQMRTVR